ncbi:hypothetical protein [Streptomyces sp. BA2]|uniref:hypothetical protein n=1 Tax=Streptomyces sp. BA2 TaxID=436595 RepID=UPI0013236BC5|nr:hypothetical protein [Streptomyces sp. BA2]MWA08791.1 hypothetical protein [Streptomyces sp. BA2]
MNQLHIDDLTEGDELGSAEIPECCDALMDEMPSGFQCGRCASRVDFDADRTVTDVRFA